MSKPRRVHNAIGELFKYPMEKLPSARCYRPGDVIAFERKAYWHYAIVIEVVGCIITIIEYQSEDVIDGILAGTKCCSLSGGGKAAVTYNRIDFNVTELWSVSIPNSEWLRDEEVVQRAKSRLGEEMYGVIFNNCEHFAFWCKTGEAYSSQVNTAAKFAGQQVSRIAAKGIAGAMAKKAIKNAAQETVEPIVSGMGKRLIQTGAKSTSRPIAAAMMASDMGVCLGFAVWDIANTNEKYQSGQITKDEFKSVVGTRAAVAVGDMSLSAIGVMIGTALGGPVGGVVGGTIGSVYGSVLGATTAHIVQSTN